jgi:hypothetical protein
VSCASCRPLEHRSYSFQSGPVGQSEYTHAAKGGGWRHLRSYTSGLCSNLVGIKPPPPPSTWQLVFAFRLHCPLGNKGAGCRSKTSGASCSWHAEIACCPSAAVAPEWLQMQRKVIPSRPLRPLPPNPSIEGMPKRLRLLVTPHVKR